ncbi:MAG: hypothetical protein U1E33_02105 [Rhodospirillales bacterium]
MDKAKGSAKSIVGVKDAVREKTDRKAAGIHGCHRELSALAPSGEGASKKRAGEGIIAS